jgi:carbonic anhydrase
MNSSTPNKSKGRITPAGGDLSRRHFVRISLATTAGTLFHLMKPSASPFSAPQTALAPDEALSELIEGNRRYVSGKMTAHEHDLKLLRDKNADKQEPFAAVLACADSRVPVEVIFDQTIGQVFVCRLAGNVTTPEVIASLEYAAAALGVKVIMVLGHSKCGAVEATIQGSAEPGQISALYPHIQPAIDLAGKDSVAAIKANACIQRNLLAQASTVLSGLVKDKKIKIVAGYYDVATGLVTMID